MRPRLGQHFLTSRRTLHNVANVFGKNGFEVVVEIGAGKGALTEYLLQAYEKVVAIEKDGQFAETLREKFANEIKNGSLQVVFSDVRDVRLSEVVRSANYCVIANIPYYITGLILRRILSDERPPRAAALVVQKEVAERVTRKDRGKESLLSLSVQFFGNPHYIQTIPRRSFSPPPEVSSALLTVTEIKKPGKQVEEVFFKIIGTAFREKRKTVLKKFKDEPHIQNLLRRNGILDTARAEDIPFSVWRQVAKNRGRYQKPAALP